MYVVVTDI